MFTNLPDDLQKEIATYLDTSSLRFFAQTSRRSLKNALPELISRQRKLLRPPNLTLMADDRLSCCYTSDAIYACGYNGYHRLGLSHDDNCLVLTQLPKLPGTIQQVAVGNFHTLVLTDQGLYVCGRNDDGQLGLGHRTKCTTFTLLPTKLLGTVRQVVAGFSHTLVLTDQGLYACGRNDDGQLGLGSTDYCVTTLTPVPNLSGTIQQVVAGKLHTLVLTSRGLYACGRNSDGQLGLNHTTKCTTFTLLPIKLLGTVRQVLAAYAHTLVLTDQGLYGCGDNRWGQLGLGHTNTCLTLTPQPKLPGTIQQVLAGHTNTLVLTDQGLYICGSNFAGQLGLGHITTECTTLTPLTNLTPLTKLSGTLQQIVVGATHTLVLTDKGLYTCGENLNGQLGLDHSEKCATLTLVKELPPKLKQLIGLYRQLDQLIVLSGAKSLASQDAESLNPSQHFMPKS